MSSDDKPEGSDPKVTGSITETDLSDTKGASKGLDALLGPELAGAPPAGAQLLLRFDNGRVPREVARELNFPEESMVRTELRHLSHALVFGPFASSTLRALAENGQLGAIDQLMESGGRWKPVRMVFADLVGGFTSREELTETATVEASLELEALDDQKAELPQATKAPVAVPAADERVVPSLRHIPASPRPARPAESAARRPADSHNAQHALLLTLIVVAGVGLWLYQRRQTALQNPADVAPSQVQAQVAPPSANVPESLRPRRLEELFEADGELMRKIRPVLRAYERGAAALGPDDERLLRVLAAPGSASWEVRRLAANQLAVYYFTAGRSTRAREVLEPIYNADPTDAVTLLNLSLMSLAEGKSEAALELAQLGAGVSPTALKWVALSILGLIHGQSAPSEAENSFRQALSFSANNPVVYGVWLRTLTRSSKGLRPQAVAALLQDALWSDPDRLVDSPIAAPLAGHLLLNEAVEGLRKAAEVAGARISAGQAAYLRWVESRYRLNPLSQNMNELMQKLGQESSPLSKLLYAYVLKETGQLAKAKENLEQVMPRLEKENVRGSWPWSFAGDIYRGTNDPEIAAEFYRRASERESSDPAALLGQSLILRDKGDFVGAEQRLKASLSLDPAFVPALLRMDRFAWQQRYRAE